MIYKDPRQRPIDRVLDDPYKEISKATYGMPGLLSKLWRTILYDLKVSGYRYSSLMTAWTNAQLTRAQNNPEEKRDHRGNLNRQFSDPKMSWNVLSKGIMFLRAKKIKLTAEITHENDDVTVHHVGTIIGDGPLPDDDPNDDKDNLEPLPDDQEEIPYLDPTIVDDITKP